MKNRIFLVVGCLVLLGSAIGNVYQFGKSRIDKARIANLSQSTSNGNATIIERYIRDSVEHVVTKEVFVKSEAEKAIAVGAGYLDTLSQALQVASRKIDEVTKINGTLLAENLQLKKSDKSPEYHFSDKYLKLTYLPDSNRASLQYDVALNSAKYWKRKWLFGEKQYYNDMYADDPRVTINSVKRFTQAEERQKRFGFGGHAGYGYSPLTGRLHPVFSVGLNYNLFEF